MKRLLVKGQLWLMMALTLSMVACSSDDETNPIENYKPEGIFVVCQGNFDTNNGDVSWYNGGDSYGSLYNTGNGMPLGDVIQDFTIIGEYGFLVANNSQKVEVVRMRDFKPVATISGLSYPRYVAQASENEVYITNGNGFSDNEVVLVDLPSFEISKRISVGNGPEMMVKVGTKMYVANSGGWGAANTVSVINIPTASVEKTITTGFGGKTLKADREGNVWVYCGGLWEYPENEAPILKQPAKLIKINATTAQVEKEIAIDASSITTYGSNLLAPSATSDHVYVMVDGIYKVALDATELPAEKWYDTTFFGIDVDQATGNVYCADSNNNKVVVLNPDDASVVTELEKTGAFPHKVVINQ